LSSSFIYFLAAALGSYDLTVFTVMPDDTTNETTMDNASSLSTFGIIYMVIYLFVNMILMLNMIIAILAEVFA
jgi:hypothetical protein